MQKGLVALSEPAGRAFELVEDVAYLLHFLALERRFLRLLCLLLVILFIFAALDYVISQRSSNILVPLCLSFHFAGLSHALVLFLEVDLRQILLETNRVEHAAYHDRYLSSLKRLLEDSSMS